VFDFFDFVDFCTKLQYTKKVERRIIILVQRCNVKFEVQTTSSRNIALAYDWHGLQKLDTMYRSRDALAVRRFLRNHPHLIDVILEAYPHLMKHFGPATQFDLEIVSDPEAEGWDQQLFAYIITPLPVDKALARLEKLDEEWFLSQLDRVGGLFNFDLECV
jgi:hypothetical protein